MESKLSERILAALRFDETERPSRVDESDRRVTNSAQMASNGIESLKCSFD